MPRHDGSRGEYDDPGRKGKGHRGLKVMRKRREASGLSKTEFEAMLRRLGIRGRGA